MVERLFLPVPWDCLQFVIVAFPDHTHLLFLNVSHIVPKIDEIRILMSNENSPHILGLCKLSYVKITLKASYQYVTIISFVKIEQIPKKKMAGVYWSLNVKRRLDIEI